MGAIKKLVFAGGLVLMSSLSVAAPVAVDPGSTFVLKMVKPIELNASVGSVTSAPTTCSSRTIMWSGSASCSSSVPAMSNGSTRTLNDTTGKVGSATVSCNAATNAISVSGGSSCTNPVAANNNPCVSQAVSWGSCSAVAANESHSRSLTVSDSTSPSTGTASFTCNNGSYIYSSGNCSTAATTCTNKTVNWSIGGNACGALSGVTNDGANKTVSNTASNGNTGNATFTCTAASDTYSLVGSPTCAPPPATACTSQTLGWNVGGTSCASNSGSVNNGVTTTLASTNGNSGSAQFTCNASTNTFSQTGTPSCEVPPPSTCTSQSKTWGTAPGDCAALTGVTNNGASKTISNTASNGNTGSATYVCNAGTNTYTVSGTPTCSQPAPTACTSQTKSWGTAPANCSAVTGATNNSVSKTVANTLNANSGSATYVCNAATDTYTVSGTPTCSQPAPTSCTSQTKTWTAGGNSCSGSTGATNDSVSKTVTNTLNSNSGSATYVCDATTDTYTVSGTPTCIAAGGGYKEVFFYNSSICGIKIDDTLSCWGLFSVNGGKSGHHPFPAAEMPGMKVYLPARMFLNGILFNNGSGISSYGYNSVDYTLPSSTGSNVLTSPLVVSNESYKNLFRHCGLLTNGSAKCWGLDAPAAINQSLGFLGSDADTAPSTVRKPNRTQTVPLPTTGNFTYSEIVDIGAYSYCGIIGDKTVRCWGNGDFSQNAGDASVGSQGSSADKFAPLPISNFATTRFISLSGNLLSGGGITEANDVVVWGKLPVYGGFGAGKAVAPMLVAGGVKFKSFNIEHTVMCGVALNDDGYCWGNNTNNALGNGTTGSSYPNPQLVSGGIKFKRIVPLGDTICGQSLSNQLYCWGNNLYGQMGLGGQNYKTDSAIKAAPVLAFNGMTIRRFMFGPASSVCVVNAADDKWYCAGNNINGTLGNGIESCVTGDPSYAANGFCFEAIPNPTKILGQD